MNCMYLFFATLIVAVFFSESSYADTTYKVKKGDNPYTIAKKFNVNHNDIIRINTIDPKLLKPGTRITIPSKKTEKPRKASSSRTSIADDPAPVRDKSVDLTRQADPSFHIVKRGDTISFLSKKYSIPQHEIKKINKLRSSKLKIGQKLTIKRSDPAEYTVQKGDTVWKIARRFDIDLDRLREINSLETDSLRPGQKILVKQPTELTESKPYETILSQASEEPESEQLSEHQSTIGFGLEERLILFAKKMLDIPYRFGGNSLLGIDCSAYVKRVYSLIGVSLPRSAREQFKEGIPVDQDNLSIGDLVFFRTYASYPSHVGIYLGNNLFIHASSKRKKVTIDSLSTPFYLKRFIGAKRLLDASAKSQDSEKEG